MNEYLPPGPRLLMLNDMKRLTVVVLFVLGSGFLLPSCQTPSGAGVEPGENVPPTEGEGTEEGEGEETTKPGPPVPKFGGGVRSRSGLFAIPTNNGTVIRRGSKVLATVPNSHPISFSPTADILLLKETGQDDDLRQYLLNVGKGEFEKDAPRGDYVFGSRYVTSASWSNNGKTLTLHNAPGLTENDTESFTVAELLK